MTHPHPPALHDGATSEEAARAVGADALTVLARQASGGDQEALARLLSLVAPSIVAAVRMFAGGERADIEDMAQEALMAIADAVPRFRGDSTFLHYARRIAVRTALSMRHARRQIAGRLAQVAAAPPDSLPFAGGSPTDGVEREERLEVFRRLLDDLPEGQAESLMYRVLLDYPLPTIAHETGVPVNTVRSRIRLARDHLRERILGDPDLVQLLREPA